MNGIKFPGSKGQYLCYQKYLDVTKYKLKGYTSFYTFVVTASTGKLESQLAAGGLGLGVERKPKDTHCWVVGLI